MRKLIRQLRAALARRIRYRVTHGGLLFTFAIVVVAASAIVSANNLLFLILATMLSTLLVSGFISRLCLAGLELDLILPEHISAGRVARAKLCVRNLKAWMPSFSIHVTGVPERALVKLGRALEQPAILTAPVYFPVIPGGAVLEENVDVKFDRRGTQRQNTFVFTTRFPFGFLDKTERVTLRREVLVYPSIEPQPGFVELLNAIVGEIESHMVGLGRDFYRIRPYEPFESARHLDWKASAHTGNLQVREFAREQERAVEIFLDRDVPPHLEHWFERAIECCAYLAWSLWQMGAGIRFRSQQFDIRVPEEGDVYAILKYLSLVFPQSGKPAENPADVSSFQIVFSPAPDRFRDLGWAPAHLLSPDSFSASGLRMAP
ncbi:MAG TPA: DUF58 domain-containing protein [Bryobacteraceae bacterium]|nr:DUF58 domain-containing protein [Bryobacteraceae bacterium]